MELGLEDTLAAKAFLGLKQKKIQVPVKIVALGNFLTKTMSVQVPVR